jgi:hypothetical protein
MLESLESRRYFTIPVVGGVAAVGGGATNEVFELILSSGVLQLRNGAGTVIDSVVSAGVTGVSITGGGGNDFIRIGKADGTGIPGVNCTLRGGAGNDNHHWQQRRRQDLR